MFVKKLEKFFLLVMAISLSVLLSNWYESYMFDNTPLSDEKLSDIKAKEMEVLANMQKNYGYSYSFPLIITDKIGERLYGLTSYESDGTIKIYLNKRVMKESMEYMLESVIAHEYAHALLFKQNAYSNRSEGHTALWKQTCQKLGGKNCAQYVDSHDVVMGKMPF